MIHPNDLNLIQVIDEAEKVVDAIFNHYQTRGPCRCPKNTN